MRRIAVAAVLSGLAAPAWACQSSAQAPMAMAGSVVTGAGGDITTAWYGAPTTIYTHGVLGDAVEAGALVAASGTDPATCAVTVLAGDGHVFEDVAPRLADLDGDGRTEVIAVRTSIRLGAQLAIYGLRDGNLTLLATTPYIGQTHRWLAPVGAGDLDGDGVMEVAYVDRPHLVKELRVWRFDGAALHEVYRVPGLTNHRIGDPTISGGIRTCGGVTEAVSATADWSRVVALRIADGKALMRDLGPMAADAFDRAMACDQ